MRQIVTVFSLALASIAGTAGVGCTANIHDNTLSVQNPKVNISTDVDVQAVQAGSTVPVTLSAQNVFLVDPKTTPPPEHERDAGYFEIFLDNTDGNPLVVTASTSVSVTIPAETKEGPHKILCRLNAHDGSPTDAVQELDINVKASASVSVSTSAKKKDGG